MSNKNNQQQLSPQEQKKRAEERAARKEAARLAELRGETYRGDQNRGGQSHNAGGKQRQRGGIGCGSLLAAFIIYTMFWLIITLSVFVYTASQRILTDPDVSLREGMTVTCAIVRAPPVALFGQAYTTGDKQLDCE